MSVSGVMVRDFTHVIHVVVQEGLRVEDVVVQGFLVLSEVSFFLAVVSQHCVWSVREQGLRLVEAVMERGTASFVTGVEEQVDTVRGSFKALQDFPE